ncbi:hypothetical protein [Streptomyces sp. NPDC058092]|uniref:hypothetical protein n=1 Tax=Streptomyces sp. NPDC058092 TaxID=3346336 RepID=UPI0036E9E1F3
MRRNPDNLRQAAARKSAAARARAEKGLRDMIRRGEAITFRGLAQSAALTVSPLDIDQTQIHRHLRLRVPAETTVTGTARTGPGK